MSERGVIDTWFRDRRIGKTGPGPESVVGVTLWEYRPATDADDPRVIFRFREPGSGSITSWVGRRASAARALAAGARVRIAIESAQEGYLYVIDREVYEGGSSGKPYLIFPTTRTRGGDNSVKPGRLIEIPAAEDSPPFFVLKSAAARSDYAGELLTVIVSPQLLPELPLLRTPLELTIEQVRHWEKQWGADTRRYSVGAGAGGPPGGAAQQAGFLVERLLTHEDPTPQDYYVVSVKPGSPFLVEIPVRLR